MVLRESKLHLDLFCLISIIIVGAIFMICKLFEPGILSLTRNPVKRFVKNDVWLIYSGGLEVNYVKGSTTAYTFDLCT